MRKSLFTALAVIIGGSLGVLAAEQYIRMTTPKAPLKHYSLYFPESVQPIQLLGDRMSVESGCGVVWLGEEQIFQVCSDHVMKLDPQ